MSIEFFDPPSSRAKFERNLNLLGEALKQGRFKIASNLSASFDGIRRVRFLPNHRIDLLTVDEMTRLNANMITRMSLVRERLGQRPTVSGEQEEGATPERANDEQ